MSGKKIIIRLSYGRLFLSLLCPLLFLFALLSTVDAPTTYGSQSGTPNVTLGVPFGAVSNMNSLDAVPWNITEQDSEAGLKTVEFFIGQDNSTGIASGTTTSWPASIFLPEDNITVDGAFIEITMHLGATDISAGTVNIDGKNISNVPLLQTTGPTTKMLYNYNATGALVNFTKGTNAFTLNVAVTGPINYAQNAKLILTYRYNRNSETQLKTVRYFVGSIGKDMRIRTAAPGSHFVNFSNLRIAIPEGGPISVKSAWIEATGSYAASAATPQSLNFSINANDQFKIPQIVNVAETKDFLILYNATPFYRLVTGFSPTYYLNMSAFGGFPVSAWGAEAILTYTYNNTNGTGTEHRTARFFAIGNTTRITAVSRTNATLNIYLPEDNPAIESVYFRIAAENGGASGQLNVSVNGTTLQGFQSTWSTETAGIFPILVNGTNYLNTKLKRGDNFINLTVINTVGTFGPLTAEAVVTYNYSSGSPTMQETVQYHIYQSTDAGAAAGIVTGNFTINMPPTAINVTSAYVQSDPTIRNTGTSLTGATSTGYGTWLNGTGVSGLVYTTDENLYTRTMLNATKILLNERILGNNITAWGGNAIVVSESNWATNMKLILTYGYKRQFRAEVEHNSTQMSYTGNLLSANATVRFMGNSSKWWNLYMYNWAIGNWVPCINGTVPANTWQVWKCNITSFNYTVANFVSADGVVKINMNSTNDTSRNVLGTDYVSFDLTAEIPSLSIALTGNLTHGIPFGSIDPNTVNNNASGNYNTTAATQKLDDRTQYWVYTGPGSQNADICIRDNESLRTGGGATPTATINNGNYTYHNGTANSPTSPALSCAGNNCGNMTDGYIRFAANVPAGTPAFLRFFLNVSGGQTQGTYSNGVYFLAVAAGSSVTCGT